MSYIREDTNLEISYSSIIIEQPEKFISNDIIQPVIRNNLTLEQNRQVGVCTAKLNDLRSFILTENKLFDYFTVNTFLTKYYVARKNAEIVNGSNWLEMYEIINSYNLIDNKNKLVLVNNDNDGDYISAVNHYCKTHGAYYNWLSNFYYVEEEADMYTKEYYSYFRSHLCMSRRLNGDITSLDNIDQIKTIVEKKFSNSGGKVDIFIGANNTVSNIKYYDFYQLLLCFKTLNRDGSLVLKLQDVLSTISIDLILLCSYLFRSISLYKPMTSSSLDIYLVGKGFYGLTSKLLSKLLIVEENLSKMDTDDDIIFIEKTERNSGTVETIINSLSSLINQQNNFDVIQKIISDNENIDTERLYEQIYAKRARNISKYLTTVRLRKLNKPMRID